MELGTIYRILRALSSAAAAYCIQILLTIDGAVKHAEEPDEGNPQVRLTEKIVLTFRSS
jgi:hypothetical protein